MLHPEFEILSGDDDEARRRCTSAASCRSTKAAGKVTTKILRTLIHRILQADRPLDDALPQFLRDR